jgi:pimeloyl-ACP methyl ester carboxylesterase
VSLVASVRDASAEGERGPKLGDAAPLDDLLGARAPVVWKRTWVDERPAMYGVAGEGLPVVILHGWGLAHHAYKGTIQRLVALGCRVYAPAQPGFGGTADLPRRDFSLAGYARWVEHFLDALQIDEPVFLIGHSFGGGVAIRVAHDYPERVRSLVLVNSIGGSAWKSGSKLKSLADRPLWDWGLHFPSDIWPIPQATKVIPIMLEDALPNLLRNPRAMLKVGFLARRVDLTYELEALKQRSLPVVVLWGARDGIIPRESFDALCAAVGAEGQVVDGSHSWLLADPDGFGEVITNAVEVARVARELEAKSPPRRHGFMGKDRKRVRTLRTVAGAKPADES